MAIGALQNEDDLREFIRLQLRGSDQGRLVRQLQGVEAVHLVGAAGEPAFQSGWVNSGGAGVADASFYRKGERVYTDGYIKNGTINAVAFTFPVGYRPGGQQAIGGYSNGGFGALVVSVNGDAVPQVGSNVLFSLSGLSFRVA